MALNLVQEKVNDSLPLGLYFHIPFCASSCAFCAFYQEQPTHAEIECYFKGIEIELLHTPINRPVKTIFFGGGTPGILSAKDLAILGKLIYKKIVHAPKEWTIELAPSTVKIDKIKVLKDLGVNRFSLGVQSFQDPLLEKLGRRHSRKQIFRAIEILQKENISNLNIDLLLSIPGQSLSALITDMDEAIQLSPTHVSTYTLTFEDDTALYARLMRGDVKKQSDDEEILCYKTAREKLQAAGYEQYEISNFARPGYACLHNVNTWRMSDWIGFGPSAASQYRGKRYTNVPNLHQWLKGLHSNQPYFTDEVTLTKKLLATDALVFGLRMNDGVNIKWLLERFPEVDWGLFSPLWHQLEKEGLMKRTEKILCLTDRGRLLADAIGTAIINVLNINS